MSARLQQIMGRIHGPLTAHFAKRGAVVPNLFDSPTKRQLLEWRNDARREINDLQARAASQERTDSITLLGQWVGALQEAIDALEQMDAAEPVDQNSSRSRVKRSAALVSGTGHRAVELRLGKQSRDELRGSLAAINEERFTGDEGEDATLGDLLKGMAGMKTSDAAKRALASGTGAAGGFSLSGSALVGILDALAPESTVLRAGGRVLMLQEQAPSFRWAAVNTLPVPAWRAEGATVSESDPVFREILLTPRSLSVYFRVSRELLADSPVLGDSVQRIVAQAFAAELDRVALRGTGTAPQPRGILNTAGIVSIANGANGTALGTLGYSNFVSALQLIRQNNAPAPTAAIMSPRTMAGLVGLLDTTNQPRQAPPLIANWQMLNTSAIPNTLVVGTSNDCSEVYFGDFTNVGFGIREDVNVQVLRETFATTGEVAFMCHARVDVGVLYPGAFAVATGIRP